MSAISRAFAEGLVAYPAYAQIWWDQRHMRLGQPAIDSVAFIGVEANGTFTPIGTCFFGAYFKDGTAFQFLITARHLLDDYSNCKLSVRVNRKSGGCDVLPLPLPAHHHVDPAFDVCILPIRVGADIYQHTNISLNRDRRKTGLDQHPPGPGDEVAIVGVYTSQHGLIKNLPIVRVGHIASLPSEPVVTSRGATEGYLIEVHSIGGLSGSPVFFRPAPVQIVNREPQFLMADTYPPIGILVGYHLVASKTDEILVSETQGEGPPDPEYPLEQRRTGLAVAIPIERVFELVEEESIQEAMMEAIKKGREGSGYVSTGVPAKPSDQSKVSGSEHPPIAGDERHKERFTALLGEVLGKPKQGG